MGQILLDNVLYLIYSKRAVQKWQSYVQPNCVRVALFKLIVLANNSCLRSQIDAYFYQ